MHPTLIESRHHWAREEKKESEGEQNETERQKGADRAKINNSQDAAGPKANGSGAPWPLRASQIGEP